MEEHYYRSMSEFDDEFNHNGPRSDFFDEGQRRAADIVSDKEVDDYLELVVTGVQFEGDFVSGKMIVSFEKLKELVDEGYNIVEAKSYGPYRIDIVYQKYEKNINRKGR